MLKENTTDSTDFHKSYLLSRKSADDFRKREKITREIGAARPITYTPPPAPGCAPQKRPHTTKSPNPDQIWESVPTAEEVFGPRDPAPLDLPSAWIAEDSIARELADRECARLLVNTLYDPPITDAEIERHARQHGLSFGAAEIEVRRSRHD